MSMQGTNLPADRMIRVEEILIHADDVMIAERFNETPMIYTEGTRYNKGLQITFRDGKYRRINTEMTVLEFEIERAKKFTPVVPEITESGKLAGVGWDEGGWSVDEVRTEWSYYHKGTDQWIGTESINATMDVAKRQDTKYRAVMYRKISKEWDD